MQDANIKYGCFDPLADTRDFVQETKDELLDAINYQRMGIESGDIPIIQGAVVIRFLKDIYRLVAGPGLPNLPKSQVRKAAFIRPFLTLHCGLLRRV